MPDITIVCPICKYNNNAPLRGSISNYYRRSNYSSASYEQNYRQSSTNVCSLCRGSGFIDENVYNDIMNNLRKNYPLRKRDNNGLPVGKIKREIDLD